MIHRKWLQCFAFIISFVTFYGNSVQASNNNVVPFDLYVECISALNKYRESGANAWLLLCYEKLWILNSNMIFDDTINNFLNTPVNKLAQLNQILPDQYTSSLLQSINTALVKNYSSELYLDLLRYLTIDNVSIIPLRADALIILNLLQKYAHIPNNIKLVIDSGINIIKSKDFTTSVTEEDLRHARTIVTVLYSYLKPLSKETKIPQIQEGLSEQSYQQDPTPSVSKEALKKAAIDLQFSHDIKLLEQQSLEPLQRKKPLYSPFYQEAVHSPQTKISSTKKIEEPNLYSKITDFVTTIKNKISSFFEPLFKRSNDQPWQWK